VDTAVHPEADRAELAALRRRAFGPDADILDDPAALERLRELEGFVPTASPLVWSSTARPRSAHADDAPAAPTRGGRATASILVTEPAALAASDREEAAAVADEDDLWADEEQTSARRPQPRRLRDMATRLTGQRPGRTASVLVAAVLVAAVGVGIGWQVAQPHPDRILAADGTQYTPSGQGTDLWLKEMYGITGAFRGHELYGHIHVFTGTARDGSECMVLMIGTEDALGTSCSPRPLPASVDLFILPGWGKEYTGLALPAGSVVRFVQSGDDVEVWTAIMPTSAPTL
jgi:hypothetical protein